MTTQTQDSMKLVAVLPPAEQAAYYATARRACSLEAYKANAVAAEVERAIKEQELTLKGQIAAEVNGDGKPVFSNTEKRDAEFAVRAAVDPMLIAAREELDKVKLQAATCNIDATYNADMVRILCAFAQAGNEVL